MANGPERRQPERSSLAPLAVFHLPFPISHDPFDILLLRLRLCRPPRRVAKVVLAACLAAAVVLLSQLAPTAASQQPDGKSAALATADQVLADVSKTTGLPIKGTLQKKMAGRPEIQKYLTQNLRADYSPEELHVQEATLKAFGLAASDFNLEQFLIKFYTEQAAGFYDPHTKTMYMADWIDPQMQETVLAHELTHALQDQNFDLDKFLHAERDNDDATSARQAIVEGHAMAAMMQHMLGTGRDLAGLPSVAPLMARVADEKLTQFPTFSTAPFFFRLQALFPYLQGMDFIQRGLKQGGWKELSRFFADPPTTTKELFQPDIYFEHKPLPKVTLAQPAPLANVAGLQFMTGNTMGELGYYAVLGQLISEDEAKPVAMAWLADRYILYEYAGKPEGSGKYVLVARTKWSSTEQSQAFFRDYQTILQKKYPALAPDARSKGDLFIGGLGANRVILIRDNDEIRWCEGVPAAQADAMLNYLNSL